MYPALQLVTVFSLGVNCEDYLAGFNHILHWYFFLFFLCTFKGIRSALLGKVLPAVQGTCSLLSAKISYSKSEGISCEDLWRNICHKRDECDQRIKKMKGVAFFFSSIAALERRTKGKSEKANKEKENEDYNEQNDEVQEKHWPAINYWIEVQSSNGMRVSTVPLHSTLLQTGMEVTARALPVCKRGEEEKSCAPLCTTLKDHNNNFMQSMACLFLTVFNCCKINC